MACSISYKKWVQGYNCPLKACLPYMKLSSVEIWVGLLIFAGRDQCVVLWSLEDHITSIQEQPPSRSATPTGGAKNSGNAGGSVDLSNATCVYPRGIFKGHTDTVEDVQFRPSR